MKRKFIDGSTLLGVSIAIFALRDLSDVGSWKYWSMVIVSIIYLLLALGEFLSKPKSQ